jgi:hypothetical protein
MNRMEDKNYIISTEAEKAFGEIQQFLMIKKMINKLSVGGICIKLLKVMYKETMANIMLNVIKLKALVVTSGTK